MMFSLRHFCPSNLIQRLLSQSNDINNVTLIGSVYAVENKIGNTGSSHTHLTILTRNRYRGGSQKQFNMKLIYHRVNVFEEELLEKVKYLNRNDRVCIKGYICPFRHTETLNWIPSITAQFIAKEEIVSATDIEDNFNDEFNEDITSVERI